MTSAGTINGPHTREFVGCWSVVVAVGTIDLQLLNADCLGAM